MITSNYNDFAVEMDGGPILHVQLENTNGDVGNQIQISGSGSSSTTPVEFTFIHPDYTKIKGIIVQGSTGHKEYYGANGYKYSITCCIEGYESKAVNLTSTSNACHFNAGSYSSSSYVDAENGDKFITDHSFGSSIVVNFEFEEIAYEYTLRYGDESVGNTGTSGMYVHSYYTDDLNGNFCLYNPDKLSTSINESDYYTLWGWSTVDPYTSPTLTIAPAGTNISSGNWALQVGTNYKVGFKADVMLYAIWVPNVSYWYAGTSLENYSPQEYSNQFIIVDNCIIEGTSSLIDYRDYLSSVNRDVLIMPSWKFSGSTIDKINCLGNGNSYIQLYGATEIVVNYDLKNISSKAFYQNTTLEKFTVGQFMGTGYPTLSIGESAFEGCTSLTTLGGKIGSTGYGEGIIDLTSVTDMADNAFRCCTAIEYVYVSNDINNIFYQLMTSGTIGSDPALDYFAYTGSSKYGNLNVITSYAAADGSDYITIEGYKYKVLRWTIMTDPDYI